MGSRVLWLLLGVLVGLALVPITAVVVINLVIPWDEICLAVAPMQAVADSGVRLAADLDRWLEQAQQTLALRPEATAEAAPGGLSGLLDRAADITADAASIALDVLTAPLSALIELGQLLLAQVREAVDAARTAIAAVDSARCE